jgi:putative methyltransferase (TIGR04325 family)
MNKGYKSTTVICVFAYKRPAHLRACLSALLKNDEARDLDLRVYVDGPKQLSDADAHQNVLSVCNEPWPFSDLKVIQRESNEGLYKSLTSGISETLCDYESVIVVEDDIEASPFLIRYLLDGLHLYLGTKDVASIHGYTPPIMQQLPETFFLRGADCWGWATWSERWKLFRHDAAQMAQEIRERGLVHEFNLNGNYDYLAMLDERAAELNNSWAICWHASCFLANKLTLYPGKSLVRNIGLDGSGEHCGPSQVMATKASQSPVRVEKIPVEVSSSVYSEYCNHFSTSNRTGNSPLKAIKAKIKIRLLKLANRINHSRLALIGPYDYYEEAAQRSSGYECKLILDKVYKAVVDVLEGNYAYERDGTVFAMRPSIDHLRRLLSTHLKENDVVVDFGGGLGGAFINNRDLFRDSNRYTVVEQSNFVEAGRELSKKFGLQIQFIDNLFHLSVKPDVIILSSVLQYIPNAEQVLQEVAELMPRLIIVDRTAFLPTNASQKWWIQDEPAYYQIPISYPIRPLPLEAILSILIPYSVLERWTNPFDPETPPHGGFLLCRLD